MLAYCQLCDNRSLLIANLLFYVDFLCRTHEQTPHTQAQTLLLPMNHVFYHELLGDLVKNHYHCISQRTIFHLKLNTSLLFSEIRQYSQLHVHQKLSELWYHSIHNIVLCFVERANSQVMQLFALHTEIICSEMHTSILLSFRPTCCIKSYFTCTCISSASELNYSCMH